tara:strand:+ start:1391 stop:1510 length:120 start_codon:yes stop_codon:yes gene_type:complete
MTATVDLDANAENNLSAVCNSGMSPQGGDKQSEGSMLAR